MGRKKLVNGKIPPHTVCPYKKECGSNICHHQGEAHTVPYSCASARGFEIIVESKDEEKINHK